MKGLVIIVLRFEFVYFFQNGENFTFMREFLEALCQFNSTQKQESIWPMNRVIQNLQCVKCARRFVLQGNGLLLAYHNIAFADLASLRFLINLFGISLQLVFFCWRNVSEVCFGMGVVEIPSRSQIPSTIVSMIPFEE